MSGWIWQSTLDTMIQTIWDRRDNYWPAPIACKDYELQAWWDEAMEKYNMYCRLIEQMEQRQKEAEQPPSVTVDLSDKDEWSWSTEVPVAVDDAAVADAAVVDELETNPQLAKEALARLYERAEEVEKTLEAIDYEWNRRPWLKKQ